MFIVETDTLCDGWINCWTVEQDGITSPEVFDSREEAEREIEDEIRTRREAYQYDGEDFDEESERAQYRIREVSKQEAYRSWDS